jgi:glycosyltransferase involved in cell wall biosynthesis
VNNAKFEAENRWSPHRVEQVILEKKHIIHIRDSSGIFGAERVILTLAKNIDPSRFAFTLLCLRRKDGRSEALIKTAGQKGIEVLTVNVQGRFDPSAIRRIRKLLKENSADIIHSHDFKSDFYSLLASMGTGIKRVATAHGSTKDSILKRVYLFFNEKLIYNFFDRIVVVSEDLFSSLSDRGVPPKKIKIVQNGLDLSLLENGSSFAETVPLTIPSGKKVFAVIGRIFPDKGHRYFLEAFVAVKKNYPDIFGLIVGDGPAMSETKQLVAELGLSDSIVLCGVRSDMKTIYEMIDFLVIPSLREGLPYVLLEAMASHVPVVATSVGDIPLLVRDGETGYLVPAGDVRELTKRMADLLADPKRSAAMAGAAFSHVANKFSARIMVSETEKLYSELLTGNTQ